MGIHDLPSLRNRQGRTHSRPWVGIGRLLAGLISLWPVLTDAASDTPPATYPEVQAALRHSHTALGEISTSRPGPWGALEMTTLLLEPPESIIGTDAWADGDLSWTFTGIPADQVEPLLRQAGLNGAPLAELLATRETDTGGTVILHPTDALLLGMDPSTRYRVYALLRTSSTNTFYQSPFRVSHLAADAWFRDAAVSEQTRKLAESLTYRHREMVYFSDVRYVMSEIANATERRNFYAALLRQASLLVRLHVCRETDTEALIAYWGSNGRASEVRPLLQAMSRSDAAWPINIVMLLPAFARARLMTYDPVRDGKFRDCGWTALNFFNAVPDDAMLDPDTQARVLRNDYISVASGFLPGDIILIRNGAGTVVHICNYIADNIVFTKNGGYKAQPWTLSTLEEVVEFYTVGDDVSSVLFLRHKDAPRSEPVLDAKRAD